MLILTYNHILTYANTTKKVGYFVAKLFFNTKVNFSKTAGNPKLLFLLRAPKKRTILDYCTKSKTQN